MSIEKGIIFLVTLVSENSKLVIGAFEDENDAKNSVQFDSAVSSASLSVDPIEYYSKHRELDK